MIKDISCGAVAAAEPSFVERVALTSFVQGDYSPRQRISEHRHGVTHCTYVCEGSYWEARFAGNPELVRRGDLRFHPKGEIHSNLICRSGARCLNIEFLVGDPLGPALEAITRRIGGFGAVLERAAKNDFDSSFAIALRMVHSPPWARPHLAKAFHKAVETFLWAEICKHLPSWLSRCVRELEEPLPRRFSLNLLARLADVHPTHVDRAFRAYLGQTPGQYLRAQRVGTASEYLARTDTPLTSIALACGFCDQAHFSHAFRSFTGKTPGQFRAEQQTRR